MKPRGVTTADVPSMKLAKVGKDRERKRGGAAWFGARGAGAGFSGAAGGSGAGGVFGTGMSLAKLLVVLLVSGGVSVGAWQIGSTLANNAAAGQPAPKKLFTDKDASQKYADTSGVIKTDNSIPNSLGYISGSTDGLTSEERAKKAAAAAAAAKAEADAKAKADGEVQKKADEDASKTPPTADPAAMAAAGSGMDAKKGLTAGKFGAMNSAFGGGGGHALAGGAGLSGGINRNFSALDGLSKKGAQAGSLSAFRSPSKPTASAVSHRAAGRSNAKGFARQQLDNTAGASRAATGAAKSESASSGAAAPFDNSPAGGTVISGPGVGAGMTSGAADNTPNATTGGGSGGPLTSGTAACTAAGTEPDINGNCVPIATPTVQNAAKYQGLINTVLILMALVAAISLIEMIFGDTQFLKEYAAVLAGIVAALGAAIAAIGVMIASMTHGDFMIGAIIGAVGGFIAVQSTMALMGASPLVGTGPMVVADFAAPSLIATCAGMLAAGSAKASSLQ